MCSGHVNCTLLTFFLFVPKISTHLICNVSLFNSLGFSDLWRIISSRKHTTHQLPCSPAPEVYQIFFLSRKEKRFVSYGFLSRSPCNETLLSIYYIYTKITIWIVFVEFIYLQGKPHNSHAGPRERGASLELVRVSMTWRWIFLPVFSCALCVCVCTVRSCRGPTFLQPRCD